MKVVPLAVVLIAASLALTACGPGEPPAPTDDPVVTAPTTEPTEEGPTACTRDNLAIEYEATDGTAGQLHGILRMTNDSPDPCTIDGYPVLYFGNSEVEQPAGQPAQSDEADPPVPHILEPGNVSEAAVTITQAGNVGDCEIVQSTDFIAAPPLGVDQEFVWEDEGRDVPIDPTDSCNDEAAALLKVGGMHPAGF